MPLKRRLTSPVTAPWSNGNVSVATISGLKTVVEFQFGLKIFRKAHWLRLYYKEGTVFYEHNSVNTRLHEPDE